MNPNLNPTPLQKLRHKRTWRLVRVKQELLKKGTPIAWPTLLKIDHGYRSLIIRDKTTKKIISEKKVAYKPRIGYLMILAKLFNVKDANSIYEDRSKE